MKYTIFAYRSACYLKRHDFDSFDKFWDCLQSMRPANSRPDIIIYDAPHVDKDDIYDILWAVKIMRIRLNSIDEPNSYTVRYMRRIINHDFEDMDLV